MSHPECIARIKALCGEGPLWSERDGALYWIDCLKPALYRYDPVSRRNRRVPAELPEFVFGLALRRAGGLVLVASDGVSFLDPETGARTAVGDPEAGRPETVANDGVCDRAGRLWFGTGADNETDPIGSLYRLDPDHTIHKLDEGFVVANGPAFSADGSVLYFADSGASVIYAYDLDQGSGGLSNRRAFATVPKDLGVPDGMTVDTEDRVYSAHFDGSRITRYRPDGSIDRVIDMPVEMVTSCAFGGPGFETLFVTTCSVAFPVDWDAVRAAGDAVPETGPVPGGLYTLNLGSHGVAETPFAG